MSDYKKPFQGLANLIPSMLRNDLNTSLMNNLFDKSLTHEEAINFYGLLGKYFPNSKEQRPWLNQPDLDRQVNQLVPVMYNKIGTEEHIFTFEDLLNKASAIGINIADMTNWGKAQSFNFAPPIDLDKFVNFSSYHWVQSTLVDQNVPWNTNKLPEYYVIAKPQINEKNKLPVSTATTSNIDLNGTLVKNEIWTIRFTSSTDLVILGSESGQIASGQITNNLINFVSSQLSFSIRGGDIPFTAGDSFTITLIQLSSIPADVMFSGNGNGFLYGAKGNLPFGTMGGIQIKIGMRVLVKNQILPSENGIYIVGAGNLIRSYDASLTNLTNNKAEVYVKSGTEIGTWNYITGGTFSYIKAESNLSQWESNNFWVHENDLSFFYGLVPGGLIQQAIRPIIEYNNDLELSNITKTRFNQVPLFNLYFDDGVDTNIKSSIFHYVESPESPIDLVLQRRVFQNINNDFVFSQAVTTSSGKILFYKKNNILSSCWMPGPTAPIITNPILTGVGNGVLDNLSVTNQNAISETWSVVAITPTTFSITGSRTGKIEDATCNTAYLSDYINFSIHVGVNAFKVGDKFVFEINDIEQPRYVQLDGNKLPINYRGDPANDFLGTGTWLTSPHLLFNPELENRKEIIHGDLVDNFRSIMMHQVYFYGSSFGKNNYRTEIPDTGLGGNIKVLSKPFNLFAALLNQKGINPVTIIDFAEKQYSVSLNSIIDFIITSLPTIAVKNPIITIENVFSDYKNYYGNKPELLMTYRDTSSPIPNWPLTLPLMGISAGTIPEISYDPDFNVNILIHHDGHRSPLFSRDIVLEQSLTAVDVLRYDKTSTSGIISFSAPALPYKGQLWFDLISNQLKTLAIQFEGIETPAVASIGQYWYVREQDLLFIFSTTGWISSSFMPWQIIDFPNVVDQTQLKAEQVLYSRYLLNEMNLKWDASQSKYQSPSLLSYELGKFAIDNNLDPLGSNYVPENAFTWNYGLVNWGFGAARLARWNTIYESYFRTFSSIIPTSRPDLEPWKLFGFNTKPLTWSYDSPLLVTNSDDILSVNTLSTSNITLNSIPSILESVSLTQTTRVLLVGQTDPTENGIYVVTSSTLVRTSDPIVQGQRIIISEGNYQNSIWVISDLLITISQSRKWNIQMWLDLLILYPTLKLCINIHTDALLPPYVSNTKWESQFALTTSLPSGISLSYIFGDNGPVEQIWRKSIAFNYSQLISSFKLDPLNFLENTWGFQTFDINGLKLDKFSGQLMTHKNFTLHGESILARDFIKGIANFTTNQDVDFILTAGYQTNTGILFINSDLGISVKSGISNNILINGIPVSITIQSQGMPFVLGDSFHFTKTGSIASSTFIPSSQNLYLGLNQIYVNLLRYNSLDTTSTFNTSILRNWDIKLAYRTSSIFEDSTIEISSDILGVIPDTVYTAILKSNPLSRTSWLHALRVQVIQVGGSHSSSATNSDMIYYKPTNKGADWIFRVENYFSRHPQLTRYTITEDSNYETFYALDRAHSTDEWKFYQTRTGQEVVNLPITITGIQNVIDFIQGYILKLEDDGWAFGQGDIPDTDPVLQRIVGWQLEIEKWIDDLYKGSVSATVSATTQFNVPKTSLLNIHGNSLNPFLKGAYFNTPTGLTSTFNKGRFEDIQSQQLAYDLVGDIILPTALNVIRNDEVTKIFSNVPLFGSHMNVDEYEHLILFNKYTAAGLGLLYDPFLGITTEKLLISGKKQDNLTWRPSMGGYYISGNSLVKNIAAGIDDVANYYDGNKVFENPTTTKNALELLGFSKKPYFDILGINDKTQFNFWKGLIGSKGSNFAIDAFLNSSKFENAHIDEFWAYKIAEYGDSRTNVYPELRLQSGDCNLKHTRLYFQESVTDLPTDSYIVINKADEQRWYSLIDLNLDTHFEAETFIETFTITQSNQLVSFPVSDGYIISNGPTGGIITPVNSSIVNFSIPGTYIVNFYIPAKPKFSPVKLFDHVDKTLVEDISTWHPAFNNHTAEAFEIINVISDSDPSKYNYSTLLKGNPNFDPSRAWGDREVGRTWWDTTQLDYIPYYDKFIFSSFEERLARWGSLAEYASVKLYEWIQSDTHPVLYDAAAVSDQTDANIPNELKKSGTAARKQLYKRSRTWQTRPVAWSYVPTPPGSEQVQIFNSASTKLHLSSTVVGPATVILEHGKFSQYSLVAGMHISGWLNNKPYGELELLSSRGYLLGNSFELGGDLIVFPGINYFSLIKVLWSSNPNNIGNVTGHVEFSVDISNSVYYLVLTEVGTQQIQRLAIMDFSGDIGSVVEYDFSDIGIKVQGITNVGSLLAIDIAYELSTPLDIQIRAYNNASILIPFPSETLDNTLPIEIPVLFSESITVDGTFNFYQVTFERSLTSSIGTYRVDNSVTYLSDGLTINTVTLILTKDDVQIATLPVITNTLIYDFGPIKITATRNNEVDIISVLDIALEISTVGTMIIVGYDSKTGAISLAKSQGLIITEFGWQAWKIPSQKDLTSDLSVPFNSWQPVYGDYVNIPSTRPIIDMIVAYTKTKLTLNTGDSVEKYISVWNDWQLISPEIITQISSGLSIDFIFSEALVANRFALYINGITQLPSSYKISSNTTSLVSTLTSVVSGYKVTAIHNTYQPTTAELIFDPAILDDVSIQIQYKNDYQYVVKNIRDDQGNIQSQQYYFWVQGKTLANNGKNINCQEAELLLTEGPASYLTFQDIVLNSPDGTLLMTSGQTNISFNYNKHMSISIYLNDSKNPLKEEIDYVATDGSLIVLTNPALLNDRIKIITNDYPTRYKAVTIVGLNYLVIKDNTFNIRFTRDFILRDDPNQIDLKNSHTEWILIRPNQRTKIPSNLWNKLTDTVCGQNIAGSLIPSLTRVNYDDRHNTTTRFGFGNDQAFVDRSLATISIANTILNSKITTLVNGINIPNRIKGLDYNSSPLWFSTPVNARSTLNYIWANASPLQINEIFFEVLQDALSNNYEFSDIFKTSRLSAHSIISGSIPAILGNSDIYF